MGQNSRREPRAKVLSMTVRYRSATLGEFIEHHSYDVSRGGMFIKTPSPFPPGTLLKFEVKIADEQRLMQGVGRVVWKREESEAAESAPAGMGVKFIKIDDASQSVIERLVESRTEGSKSAFEESRDSRRMFPDRGPSSIPPPVDAVQLRPSTQPPAVKEEAPPPTEAANPSDGSVPPSGIEAPGDPTAGVPMESEPVGADPEQSSKARGKTPPTKARGSRESHGQGRGPIVFLIVVVVAALIYLLSGSASGGEDSQLDRRGSQRLALHCQQMASTGALADSRRLPTSERGRLRSSSPRPS